MEEGSGVRPALCLPEGGTLLFLRLEREGEVEWNVRAIVTDGRRDA